MLHGHCLCDAIAYEVSAPLGGVHHCHCSICRRAHGSAFSTFAQVPAAAFRIVRGEEHLRRHRTSPPCERTFCDTCGTRLTFTFDGMAEAIWVSLPTLDPAPAIRPEGHMFVASKADWFTIGDDLPQFEEYPPFGE